MTEPQAPRLELPEQPRPVDRPAGSTSGKLACVLLVVVIVLQAMALGRARAPAPAATTAPPGRNAAPDLKAIALKLEDRNLPAAAADVWRDYLAAVDLEPLGRAKVLYRIGRLGFQDGQFQQAVADLYLAERLAGSQDDDLTRRIAMQIRDCLHRSGRYAELSREMADRATGKATADTPGVGGQIVARIGDERITVADFDRILQAKIDASLAAQAGLSPAQADEYRQHAAGQFADPRAKAQFAQQMVASRVLAAEARQRGLDSSPDYRERLADHADDLLASLLMADELGKRATVTPEDARRFYEANKDRYAEPATTIIAHIRADTEESARDVLAKALAGEDFEALAADYSTDEQTKDTGGRVTLPVTRGAEFIPGIGRQTELQAAIWAVAPGGVLSDVYKSEAGWHVVRILERTERVEKSYEDVQDTVDREVRSARQQEVTQQYLEELFTEHEVELFPGAFLPQEATKAQSHEATEGTEPRP